MLLSLPNKSNPTRVMTKLNNVVGLNSASDESNGSGKGPKRISTLTNLIPDEYSPLQFPNSTKNERYGQKSRFTFWNWGKSEEEDDASSSRLSLKTLPNKKGLLNQSLDVEMPQVRMSKHGLIILTYSFSD